MKREELQKIFYLNKKIHHYQNRLEQLTVAATGSRSWIYKEADKGEGRDCIGEYMVEMIELKMIIAENLRKCFTERNKMIQYIQKIEETNIREIFYSRYIKGLSWQQIAFDTGYYNESVPRKKHDRFLKKLEKEE